MKKPIDVAIVGAGPTGLLLAIALLEQGVSVRIFEKRSQRSQRSKALLIQPRTLELFAQLGLAETFTSAAQAIPGMQLIMDGEVRVRTTFPAVDSPFQRPALLRQQITERILEERVEQLGGRVERNCDVRSFTIDEHGVTLTVHDSMQDEAIHCRAQFLCGCDGAHSTVRKQLDIAFEGKTYQSDFIQTDCKVSWKYGYERGTGFFIDDGVIACLPLGEQVVRFIVMRSGAKERTGQPELEEFQTLLRHYSGDEQTRLFDPEWRVHFRLHERIATRFTIEQRVLLLGDAAHVHTPAGGQGMNTGLQEAHNVAWKLGLIVKEIAPVSLLGSYHDERWPIARNTLDFTDRLFSVALGVNKWVLRLRKIIVPLVVAQGWIFRRVFRRVAQLEVALGDSPILMGKSLSAGDSIIAPGHRAPNGRITLERDGQPVETTVHALLAHPQHTVLLFDGAPISATELGGLPLPLRCHHVVRAQDGAYRAADGHALVIRPDGVVGCVAKHRAILDDYVAAICGR